MLDIIFSNRIMDLANIFNWADCIQYYNNMIFNGSNAIASYMESRPARYAGRHRRYDRGFHQARRLKR